jgi:nucleoside-diphosphate-sugar epimerase
MFRLPLVQVPVKLVSLRISVALIIMIIVCNKTVVRVIYRMVFGQGAGEGFVSEITTFVPTGGRVNRVLVTGAAGFIGSNLVDRLLADGYEVVGIDAFTGNYSRTRKEDNLTRANATDRFRLFEGDLLSQRPEELVRDVGAVFHLAGEPGVRRSWGEAFPRYLERNVSTTQRLLEAVVEVGNVRFIYASSSSVYGTTPGGPVREDHPCRPASPYGLSKLAAEELVRLYARERGVVATVLRYFTVYGPRQRPEMAISRFISAAALGRPVEIFGDGGHTRDMTYVHDAVAATVAALGAPGGTYNVGGGARMSVTEMVAAVGQAVGAPVTAVYRAPAPGDVYETWADSGRAERVLGYRPSVGLQEGIAAQVAWQRESRSVTASS